jgi:hypothetical protein
MSVELIKQEAKQAAQGLQNLHERLGKRTGFLLNAPD